MWALIPIKDFARAKSRLAPALAGDARAALARRLANQALDAALAAGLEHVVVMTDSTEAATIATARGVTVMRDPAGADLAARIESAARTLAACGARRLLLLASDLPRVSRAAIEELIEAAAGAEAVVSARRDDGINALISELPWPSGLTLGPGSASASAVRLSAAGRRCVKLSSGPLCEDLDVPADLALIAI